MLYFFIFKLTADVCLMTYCKEEITRAFVSSSNRPDTDATASLHDQVDKLEKHLRYIDTTTARQLSRLPHRSLSAHFSLPFLVICAALSGKCPLCIAAYCFPPPLWA